MWIFDDVHVIMCSWKDYTSPQDFKTKKTADLYTAVLTEGITLQNWSFMNNKDIELSQEQKEARAKYISAKFEEIRVKAESCSDVRGYDDDTLDPNYVFKTGLGNLDEVVQFKPGQLVLICGEGSVGATTFNFHLANKFNKNDVNCLVFYTESSMDDGLRSFLRTYRKESDSYDKNESKCYGSLAAMITRGVFPGKYRSSDNVYIDFRPEIELKDFREVVERVARESLGGLYQLPYSAVFIDNLSMWTTDWRDALDVKVLGGEEYYLLLKNKEITLKEYYVLCAAKIAKELNVIIFLCTYEVTPKMKAAADRILLLENGETIYKRNQHHPLFPVYEGGDNIVKVYLEMDHQGLFTEILAESGKREPLSREEILAISAKHNFV
jgi:hypothetical protein